MENRAALRFLQRQNAKEETEEFANQVGEMDRVLIEEKGKGYSKVRREEGERGGERRERMCLTSTTGGEENAPRRRGGGGDFQSEEKQIPIIL